MPSQTGHKSRDATFGAMMGQDMDGRSEDVRWYWVECVYLSGDYHEHDYWSLVAAESPEQIRQQYRQTQITPAQIVPYEDKPVPKTPRRTKYARQFDPTKVRP